MKGWSRAHPESDAYGLDMRAPMDRQLTWLERWKAPLLAATPSHAMAIAFAAGESRARALGLEFVFSVAETVLPRARQVVKDLFRAKLLAIYSCQEIGFIATECPEFRPVSHRHGQCAGRDPATGRRSGGSGRDRAGRRDRTIQLRHPVHSLCTRRCCDRGGGTVRVRTNAAADRAGRGAHARRVRISRWHANVAARYAFRRNPRFRSLSRVSVGADGLRRDRIPLHSAAGCAMHPILRD